MSDLYIMERSDALGIVKIGSSSNPERRRRDLQQSHTFLMKLLAVFPGKGYLECKVHRRLSSLRVWTGTGREFYSLTPTEAFAMVSDIVFENAGRAPVIALTPVETPFCFEGLKFHPQPRCLSSLLPLPNDRQDQIEALLGRASAGAIYKSAS